MERRDWWFGTYASDEDGRYLVIRLLPGLSIIILRLYRRER